MGEWQVVVLNTVVSVGIFERVTFELSLKGKEWISHADTWGEHSCPRKSHCKGLKAGAYLVWSRNGMAHVAGVEWARRVIDEAREVKGPHPVGSWGSLPLLWVKWEPTEEFSGEEWQIQSRPASSKDGAHLGSCCNAPPREDYDFAQLEAGEMMESGQIFLTFWVASKGLAEELDVWGEGDKV